MIEILRERFVNRQIVLEGYEQPHYFPHCEFVSDYDDRRIALQYLPATFYLMLDSTNSKMAANLKLVSQPSKYRY